MSSSWPFRKSTSDVQSLTIDPQRYMVGINLGDSLREDPDINNIHDQTNMIISVTNDLFSLRKELQFPFYNNV